MTGKNWNRIQPTNLAHAMELCIEFAKANDPLFSVDRLAESLGQQNKWIIYKWMAEGRLPACFIKPWEQRCGINFITRYLVYSEGNLFLKVSPGKKPKHKDINNLQIASSQTLTLLMQFYDGKTTGEETLGALTDVMQSLAWHRNNVGKAVQPEFDFGDK